jgi:hypothetical protein
MSYLAVEQVYTRIWELHQWRYARGSNNDDSENNKLTNASHVIFEVLKAVKMRVLFLWVMMPCRLVRRYRFGEAYCLHLQGHQRLHLSCDWHLLSVIKRLRIIPSICYDAGLMESVCASETLIQHVRTSEIQQNAIWNARCVLWEYEVVLVKLNDVSSVCVTSFICRQTEVTGRSLKTKAIRPTLHPAINHSLVPSCA